MASYQWPEKCRKVLPQEMNLTKESLQIQQMKNLSTQGLPDVAINGHSGTDNLEAYSNHWSSVMVTVFRLILDKLNPEDVEVGKVVRFIQPKELMEEFDFALKEESSIGLKEFNLLCEDIVHRSVKTTSPLFRNQLFGGTDAFGLAAAILLEALNTSAYTYDVAPVFSLMEREVVQQMCKLCGIQDGDGIACPGGSVSNMYALNLARFNYNKEMKQKGMFQSKRLLIFASAQSHYSVTKGAAFLGFGTDSIIYVECDSNGAMMPEDLEKKIQKALEEKDSIPLVVWCTSGTTVLNGFDPLTEIAQICNEHKLWMHTDACLGGGFLVSEKLRNKYLKGIENSDSVCWNWHKLNGAPLQTSMFLTSHKDHLHMAHGASANYLFQPDKHYDTSYDSGDSSIQCGRKADAFKIWLMWKTRGQKELAARVEDTVDVAEYMAEKIGKHPRFQLVLDKAQGTSVSFWVVPPRIARAYKKGTKQYWAEIDKVAGKLKAKMAKAGLALITFQPLADKGLVNFFRCTLTCHPPITYDHVDSMIDILVALSDDL